MNQGQKDPRLDEAKVKMMSGDNVGAKEILRGVVTENARNPEALQLLGQMSHEERNFDLARDLFKESLKLDPTQGNVWGHLGLVLNDLRETDEAIEALNKALALNPNFGRAYMTLAGISLNGGDKEQGVIYAKKALELNPELIGSYLMMAKAKTIALEDPLVANMERHLKSNRINDGPASIIHYALSYVYEQAGDTKKFFFHLKKANALQRPKDESWKDKFGLRIENMKKIITREYLAERVGPEYKIYTPIFILGMPRSGTTLTDQIFATHSMCFGGDELQYFSKYLQRMTQAVSGTTGVVSYPSLQMEHLSKLALLYQQRVQQLSPGTQFISDKMPWNFAVLGMIVKILPWAKIIHIHRDPLDCGFSCFRSPLPADLEFTCDMEDYAFYRAKYQEIMDHWSEVTPESFINLSYEEMVENPEKELRRVLDYCGLPWEDQLLDFHKTKRQVRTISSDQVNQPLNKKSIGKAMKYQDELQPMIDALQKYNLM